MLYQSFIYYLLWLIIFLFSIFLNTLLKFKKYLLKNDDIDFKYDYIIGIKFSLFFFFFLEFILTVIFEILKSRTDKLNFRFICVVGGGSAGSIIAGRLSDNLKDATVLLIEAGGDGYDIFNIPFLGPLKQMSSIDWQYTTIPQKNSCFALENNVICFFIIIIRMFKTKKKW